MRNRGDDNHGSSRREFLKRLSGGIAWSTIPCVQAGHRAAGPITPKETCSDSRDKAISEHETLSLGGKWRAIALPLEAKGDDGYTEFQHRRALGETQVIEVEVPGEIHLALIKAGQMEEPTFGDNARTRCRWPEHYSWWYEKEFQVPGGFVDHLRQRLIFNGIDLCAEVFVNGRLVGSSKDAFSPLELDLNGVLRTGANLLVVRVTSGMELIAGLDDSQDAPKDPVRSTNTERSFISRRHRYLRKPAYAAYGWDFCDALPNVGIWQDVKLEGRSKVAIYHVRIDTTIEAEEVVLQGEVLIENLHPWSEFECALELSLEAPKGDICVQTTRVVAQPGRAAIPCRMPIPEPQLWWPNGMGEQPLYRLVVRILCDGRETDIRTQTIGLRTVTLDRRPLSDGSRFSVLVNGQPVFCKGGGWASADLIPARVDASRYEKLVAEARNAHFNMIRVNGCGFFEREEFYIACDRSGILVWQDFPFTLALYPDGDPEFLSLVREEAVSAIRRLRHHPSLALWCGNNECAQMIFDDVKQLDPQKREDTGGVRIYDELLPEICHVYDPARPYLPSSPLGGARPDSQNAGDRHGPYGISSLVAEGSALADLSDDAKRERWQELSDLYRARFVSEFGIIGPPNLASVREYLNSKDISLNSTIWQIHTNAFEDAISPVAAGIRCHYGDPSSLPVADYILYGQMYQAQLTAGFVESMRFRKNEGETECSGVLNWSFNDVWGEVGWSLVDYYLRRKASYYAVRRAASPVKVLVRSRGDRLVTRVVNDTLKSYRGVVHCGWVRLDGRSRNLRQYRVVIPPNDVVEVASVSVGSHGGNSREWLYAALLNGDGVADDQAIWVLHPQKELAAGEGPVAVTIEGSAVRVASPIYCHGVHIDDGGREILADNYFDLIPGIPRRIEIKTHDKTDLFGLRTVVPIRSRDHISP